MDRRDLMKAFGAIAASTAFLSACGKSENLGGETAGSTSVFYSPEMLALIAKVADAIIPTTATPGAVAVGVPQMLDLLMKNWADDAKRTESLADWTHIKSNLDTSSDAAFLTSVVDLDARAFKTEYDKHEAYRRQKTLIAEAYYWSEPGATEELQYELNPAELIPCGPIEEIGRTWFR